MSRPDMKGGLGKLAVEIEVEVEVEGAVVVLVVVVVVVGGVGLAASGVEEGGVARRGERALRGAGQREREVREAPAVDSVAREGIGVLRDGK